MNKQKGFTLIELLVVIAILGILSTLAVVSLNNARSKARDARRVTDIKQIQTALELYYNDVSAYPAGTDLPLGVAGALTLSSTNGFADTGAGTTYISAVPSAPTPVDGTTCTEAANSYSYTQDSDSSYSLTYCLGGATGGLDEGAHTATPAGIAND